MSRIPTIRVKSDNPEHNGYIIRNIEDLRYGEELFLADEFAKLGEHNLRLKIAPLSSDDPYRIEAEMWLKQKESASSKKSNENGYEHWYKKPIGVIGIGTMTGILVFLVKYLLGF